MSSVGHYDKLRDENKTNILTPNINFYNIYSMHYLSVTMFLNYIYMGLFAANIDVIYLTKIKTLLI